jgi:hypothetical protein
MARDTAAIVWVGILYAFIYVLFQGTCGDIVGAIGAIVCIAWAFSRR